MLYIYRKELHLESVLPAVFRFAIMTPFLVSLIFGLAAAQTKIININDIVDLKLQLANRLSVATNNTEVSYGTGFVGLVQYEGAVGIGLDSIYRSGDCQIQFKGDSVTYVYNIGQSILATFFRKITYGDIMGSGYYRAINNSLEYSYTVNYFGAICNVRLQALALSLDNVEAYIQENSWNTSTDPDFHEFVQEKLLPAFNRKLEEKSTAIESNLETIFCLKPGQQQPTEGLDILRQFLFE